MIKVKRILLTGDDGYNSIGTRLLIQALKSDFDLAIIATQKQQSGVGGKVSVVGGGKWGKAEVDGVSAIWLSGTPCDCMEVAREFFPQPFDLIISGINLGVNIGGSIISSGTFSAAYRGVCLGVAPRAVAISWDVQYRLLYRNHSGKESLGKFNSYPGKTVAQLLQQAMRHNFWGSPLLNINLPAQPSSRVRFTQLLLDIYGYWPAVALDQRRKRFYYPAGLPMRKADGFLYDADVISQGDISVTPCTLDFLHAESHRKVKDLTISL